MAKQPASAAGGVFLALAILIGVLVGDAYGQASIGFLGGVAVGVMLAVGLWLMDRNRIGR